MVDYLAGVPPKTSLIEVRHRYQKLEEILGKVAIPLGMAEFTEELNQPNQSGTAKSLMGYVETHFYSGMLTSDESVLFQAIGVHLSQEVEGSSPTEAIATNFAEALSVATCFIEWLGQPQRSE
ncbi:MAG TPA: hypothetical protein V6C84_16120 [Coleofasciculaceae cyanobacterium]